MILNRMLEVKVCAVKPFRALEFVFLQITAGVITIQSVEQLYRRVQNSFIVESNKNSVYTSYSVNKGEQLVFCIRSKDNNENL